MTRAREVRDHVFSVISEFLGQFEGSGQPAIWVDSGDAPAKIRGVFCLIGRQPVRRDQVAVTGGWQISEDWPVYLQARDRSPDGLKKFDQAVDGMRFGFAVVRERNIPGEDGDYPQFLFLLEFNYMAHLYCS